MPDPSPSKLPPEWVEAIDDALLPIRTFERQSDDALGLVVDALAPLLAERDGERFEAGRDEGLAYDKRAWSQRLRDLESARAEARRLREALADFDAYASDGQPLPRGYAGSPFQTRVRELLSAVSVPEQEEAEQSGVACGEGRHVACDQPGCGCDCHAAASSSSSEEGERERRWAKADEDVVVEGVKQLGGAWFSTPAGRAEVTLPSGVKVEVSVNDDEAAALRAMADLLRAGRAALRERLTSDKRTAARVHGLVRDRFYMPDRDERAWLDAPPREVVARVLEAAADFLLNDREEGR